MENKFEEVWAGKTLTIVPPAATPPLCELATFFDAYFQESIAPLVTGRTTRRKTSAAILLLTITYFRLADKAGASHKKPKHRDHRCLYDVFEQHYREIETVMNRDLPPAIVDNDDDAEYPVMAALGILTDVPTPSQERAAIGFAAPAKSAKPQEST